MRGAVTKRNAHICAVRYFMLAAKRMPLYSLRAKKMYMPKMQLSTEMSK